MALVDHLCANDEGDEVDEVDEGKKLQSEFTKISYWVRSARWWPNGGRMMAKRWPGGGQTVAG